MTKAAAGPVPDRVQPSGGRPQEKLQMFGAEVPLGRPGQPAECAPIHVFPASQEASYVTGEVYAATGGKGTT